MSAPRQARGARSGGRFYVWDKTGERFWSVTTILDGAIPKPALIGWAANESAGYAVDNLDVLTKLIASGQRDTAIKLCAEARFKSSGKKADLGTAIHAVIDSLILGSPMPEVEALAEPYVDQFMSWVGEWQPTFLGSEMTVYNRTQQYAGTLDAIAEFDAAALLELGLVDESFDEPTGAVVLDWKTAKRGRQGHGIYPETALQLAMYRHAEFVGLANGEERPMPPTVGSAAVWLAPDDHAFVPLDTSERVFRAALYAREVFRWVEETSRQVTLGAHRGSGRRAVEGHGEGSSAVRRAGHLESVR